MRANSIRKIKCHLTMYVHCCIDKTAPCTYDIVATRSISRHNSTCTAELFRWTGTVVHIDEQQHRPLS